MNRVTLADVTTGEEWGYRPTQKDRLRPVVIVRLGSSTERSPRVRIRGLNDASEGRELWVPVSQLKVRWHDRAVFEEDEARWTAIEATRPPQVRSDAALEVLEDLAPGLMGIHGNMAAGLGEVADVNSLADLLGWEPSRGLSDPRSIVHDGKLLLPWDFTEVIIRTLIERFPNRTYEGLRRRRARAHREAMERAEEMHAERPWLSADEVFERTRYDSPTDAVILDWMGEREADLQRSADSLRQRYDDLVVLAVDTIKELRSGRSQGARSLAARMSHVIGDHDTPPSTT